MIYKLEKKSNSAGAACDKVCYFKHILRVAPGVVFTKDALVFQLIEWHNHYLKKKLWVSGLLVLPSMVKVGGVATEAGCAGTG